MNDLARELERLLRERAHEQVIERVDAACATRPDPELYNLAGRAWIGLGRRDLARACFERAVALEARFDRGWANLAKLAADEGRQNDAITLLEAGLDASPEATRLLRALARARTQLGRPDLAVELLERAVASQTDAATLRELGAAQLASGRAAAALESYVQASAASPHDVELVSELVAAASAAGRPEAAHAPILRATEGEGRASALLTLAMHALELGQWEACEAAARACLAIDPSEAQAAIALAQSLASRGDGPGAIELLERHAPAASTPHAWLELARRHRLEGDADRAAANLQAARARFPRDAMVLVAYAEDVRKRGLHAECLHALEQAVELDPHHDEAHAELSHQLVNFRRTIEATDHARAAVRLNPASSLHHASLLFDAHYHLDDPAEMHRGHQVYGAKFGYARPVPRAPEDLDPERALRVGYVSRDFREHSCAYFLLPILRHHGASVETYCYGAIDKPDAITERFRQAAHVYRDITHLSNQAAAERIAADRIDLLVDLGGMTAAPRLGIFARRPAPLQLTYLGYPDTTGLPTIDYRITDHLADPAPLADRFHTERLLRMPTTAWCFDAGFAPSTEASQGRPRRFCCFNAFAKITDAMLGAWARILEACPGWRLMLKTNLLSDPDARAQVLSGLERAGLPLDRVDFQGWTPTREAHLAMHAEVDIALDPSPYAGTTTSCDALWMGVPFVTLAGRVHSARVGASLLGAVGLSELVARDLDEYVEIAVALAHDETRRGTLRGELRSRFLASPLGDPSQFVPQLERLYRSAWREHVELRGTGRRQGFPLQTLDLGGARVHLSADPTSSEAFPLVEQGLAALTDVPLLRRVGAAASTLVDRADDAGVTALVHALDGNRAIAVRESDAALERVGLHARTNDLDERLLVASVRSGAPLPRELVSDWSSATVRLGVPLDASHLGEVTELAHRGAIVLWTGGARIDQGMRSRTDLVVLIDRPGLDAWSPLGAEDEREQELRWMLLELDRATSLERAGKLCVTPATSLAGLDSTAGWERAADLRLPLAERLAALESLARETPPGIGARMGRARALVWLGRRRAAAAVVETVLGDLQRGQAIESHEVLRPLGAPGDTIPASARDTVEAACLEAFVKLSAPSSSMQSRAVVGLLLRYQALGGTDLEMARRLGLLLAREDARD